MLSLLLRVMLSRIMVIRMAITTARMTCKYVCCLTVDRELSQLAKSMFIR